MRLCRIGLVEVFQAVTVYAAVELLRVLHRLRCNLGLGREARLSFGVGVLDDRCGHRRLLMQLFRRHFCFKALSDRRLLCISTDIGTERGCRLTWRDFGCLRKFHLLGHLLQRRGLRRLPTLFLANFQALVADLPDMFGCGGRATLTPLLRLRNVALISGDCAARAESGLLATTRLELGLGGLFFVKKIDVVFLEVFFVRV